MRLTIIKNIKSLVSLKTPGRFIIDNPISRREDKMNKVLDLNRSVSMREGSRETFQTQAAYRSQNNLKICQQKLPLALGTIPGISLFDV